MQLSKEAYEKLQALAQKIQTWLQHSPPEFLAARPDLLAQQIKLEKILDSLLPLLQQKPPQISEKGGPLHLQWSNEDKWKRFPPQLELKFWGAFPKTDFDKAKIEATVDFSFGEQTITGTLEITQEWTDENFECLRYKCSATAPADFLSGTIQVAIGFTYKDKTDELSTSLEVAGISEKGQGVLDFLGTITIDDPLRTAAFDYAQTMEATFAEAQTMDQLRPLQQRLQELLTATTALQNQYNSFAHNNLLKGLMNNASRDKVAQEHFGGHWQVVSA